MLPSSDQKLFEDFLNTHQAPNTRRAYRNDLRKLADFLCDRSVPTCLEATPGDLAAFLTEQMKRHCLSYVIHIKASVRAFYRYLHATERIVRNPGSILGTIRVRMPIRKPRALSMEQRQILLKSLRHGNYRDLKTSVAILLGLHQGLRVSEIARLRWEDVDFSGKTLRLIRKGNREHVMPMTATMATALTRLQEEANFRYGLFRKTYVFPRPRRNPSSDDPVFDSTIQKTVKKAAKSAGLEGLISVHVLRHSFATHLVDSGVDLLTVSYLMGHSSIRTTQVYVREDPRRTADELKRAFSF